MNLLKSITLGSDNMNKSVIDGEIRSYEKVIAEIQGEKSKKMIHEETKNLRVGDVFNPNIAWSLKKRNCFPSTQNLLSPSLTRINS